MTVKDQRLPDFGVRKRGLIKRRAGDFVEKLTTLDATNCACVIFCIYQNSWNCRLQRIKRNH